MRDEPYVLLGDATVPALVCETEPQTGAIRVTDKPASLPADAAQSALCQVICLACSDDDESVTDGETVTDDEDPHVTGQGEAGAHLGRLRPRRKGGSFPARGSRPAGRTSYP